MVIVPQPYLSNKQRRIKNETTEETPSLSSVKRNSYFLERQPLINQSKFGEIIDDDNKNRMKRNRNSYPTISSTEHEIPYNNVISDTHYCRMLKDESSSNTSTSKTSSSLLIRAKPHSTSKSFFEFLEMCGREEKIL